MNEKQAKSVRPLNGMVLCQVDKYSNRRPGSKLILPDSSKGRPDRCVVVAVSRGAYTARGALIEPPVKPGDICLFDAYHIDKVLADGQLAQADNSVVARPGEYILIHQTKLWAVDEKDSPG